MTNQIVSIIISNELDDHVRTIKQGVQPLQTGIRAQGSTCTPCPRPALSACHCREWLALHRAWRRLLADPHACLPCQRQRQHTPELANSNDGLAISDVAALLGLVPAPLPCRVRPPLICALPCAAPATAAGVGVVGRWVPLDRTRPAGNDDEKRKIFYR